MKNFWGSKDKKQKTAKTGRKKKRTKAVSEVRGLYSIRGKLIVSYMVPVVLILILGIISYKKAADTIISNYEISMENTIQKTAEYYELMMNTIATGCNQIAIDNNLRSYYRGAYEDEPLTEKKNFQEIKKSMFMDAFSSDFVNGIYAFASYGSPCVSYLDVKKLDYNAYRETDEGKQMEEAKDNIVFSGYHNDLDMLTGHTADEYAFTVKRNITNQAAAPIGIIVMDVSMESAKNPLLGMELGEGSVCALISPDGREISSLSEDENISIMEMEAYQEFTLGGEMSASLYREYDNREYLYLFSNVGQTGFSICTMIPEEQITEKLMDIQTATVVIVVLAIIISVVTAGVISTGMNSSIKRISKAMKAVAEGDLTVTVNMKGRDEFKKLGDHTGLMLANTKELIQRAGLVSGEVLTSVSHVSDTSGQMVGTTDNINEAITRVNEGVNLQTGEVQSCLAKMDELAEQIEQVDEETGKALERAGKSKSVVEKGIAAIDVLEEKTGETAKVTGQVIEKIEALAEETKAITEIIEAIKAIATRTNMLSLNARIEASRVGSAGSGFAVVAEEVRKLSVESMDSVERIGDIVRKIEKETKNTVLVAKNSEKIVEEQEVAMEETVTAFHEMSDSVDGLARKIEKIAGNMRNMESNKNKSMEAITNISTVSKETLDSTNQMKEAVEVQLAAVKELNEATMKLDGEARKLTRAISKFKVT